VVPERLSPFQSASLELLGFDPAAKVAFPARARWELEHLYVVTPRLKTQIDSPAPYEWFRSAAFSRYGAADPRAPARRIYVSRRDARYWRTVNEPDVEAVLAEYGFTTVVPGELDFAAQVEVFRDAEVVVGTGAGLFNLVFARPGAQVLQIQDANHLIHSFWTAAAALHFDYHYLVADTLPKSGTPVGDLSVPPDKLRASLESMGLRRTGPGTG
jgi:capsular polysaccharide biosynthesis protein